MDVSQVKIGQRVTSGKGEDRDAGHVVGLNGDEVTVAWDSQAVTTQPASLLEAEQPPVPCPEEPKSLTVWETADGMRYSGTIDCHSNVTCEGLPSAVQDSIEEEAAWSKQPSGTVKFNGQTYDWSIVAQWVD